MSEAERIAGLMVELSALRDRDRIEQRLVQGMLDLAGQGVCRLLSFETEGEPWSQRHCAGDACPALSSDGLCSSALGNARLLALQSGRPVQPLDLPNLTLFPLVDLAGTQLVLELWQQEPLAPARRTIIEHLLRLCANVRGLLDYGECDELTGLLNRKTFDECFMKLGATPFELPPLAVAEDASDRRSAPGVDPHWLAVVDVDHFKSVNDRFGHLVGDEVLLLLSQLMRANFRQHDRLYRFGGEEFVILLRCPQSNGAHSALERLRGTVATHEFPQVEHITISIGYTRIEPDDTPESAFERADQAVYHAKHNGRDQVRHHADLVAEGAVEQTERAAEVDFF